MVTVTFGLIGKVVECDRYTANIGNFLERTRWESWMNTLKQKESHRNLKTTRLVTQSQRETFYFIERKFHSIYSQENISLCRDFPGKDCRCEKCLKVFFCISFGKHKKNASAFLHSNKRSSCTSSSFDLKNVTQH